MKRTRYSPPALTGVEAAIVAPLKAAEFPSAAMFATQPAIDDDKNVTFVISALAGSSTHNRIWFVANVFVRFTFRVAAPALSTTVNKQVAINSLSSILSLGWFC